MAQKPWWKRVWPALVALVVGVLGTLAVVLGKARFAGKAMEDAQAKDNKALENRLSDADKVAQARLDAVAAEKRAAKEKADHEHEARVRAIEAEAASRRDHLLRNPDAVPGSLVSTLDRADRLKD